MGVGAGGGRRVVVRGVVVGYIRSVEEKFSPRPSRGVATFSAAVKYATSCCRILRLGKTWPCRCWCAAKILLPRWGWRGSGSRRLAWKIGPISARGDFPGGDIGAPRVARRLALGPPIFWLINLPEDWARGTHWTPFSVSARA